MMNTPENAFELQNVSVRYGSTVAIDNFSLMGSPGQCIGILGVNGAGKTTSIRALLSMVPLHSGSIQIFGKSGRDVESLRRVGYAPEEADPPDFMNPEEYLQFIGRLRLQDPCQVSVQVQEACSWFELEPQKKIRFLSKGMRRRVILAQAFIGNPELVILDEPLNGLDPLLIKKLREKISSLVLAGKTVLYSSHILAEVEKTCTQIAIVSKGALKGTGSVEEMVQKYGSIESAFTEYIKETC